MGVWGAFLVSVLLLIVCAGVLALMRRKRVSRESVETPAERYQHEVLGLRELRAQEIRDSERKRARQNDFRPRPGTTG